MDWNSIADIATRLGAAFLLGGIIGAERENEHKNAGFRTHILVCVASALVIVTSEYIFNKYEGTANIDIQRLGAQVISGIGFLGAGAIIKEGITVRGLTTAATLWSVACVGLACGAGFYSGAFITAALIMVALLFLKRFRSKFKKCEDLRLNILTKDMPGQLGAIGSVLGDFKINIKNIRIRHPEDQGYIMLELDLLNQYKADIIEILSRIRALEGISSIEQV